MKRVALERSWIAKRISRYLSKMQSSSFHSFASSSMYRMHYFNIVLSFTQRMIFLRNAHPVICSAILFLRQWNFDWDLKINSDGNLFTCSIFVSICSKVILVIARFCSQQKSTIFPNYYLSESRSRKIYNIKLSWAGWCEIKYTWLMDRNLNQIKTSSRRCSAYTS